MSISLTSANNLFVVNSAPSASIAFVENAVTVLIDGAPSNLDTLAKIATSIGNDASFNSTITGRLDGIDSLNTAQDGRLTAIEIMDASQNIRLLALEVMDASSQNVRLDAIEIMDASQNIRLDGIDSLNTAQDGRLTALEVMDASSQNIRLDAIEIMDASQNVRLDAIEIMDASQNIRLDAIEIMDASQNVRLDAIEIMDASQNVRLDGIETLIFPEGITFQTPAIIQSSGGLTIPSTTIFNSSVGCLNPPTLGTDLINLAYLQTFPPSQELLIYLNYSQSDASGNGTLEDVQTNTTQTKLSTTITTGGEYQLIKTFKNSLANLPVGAYIPSGIWDLNLFCSLDVAHSVSSQFLVMWRLFGVFNGDEIPIGGDVSGNSSEYDLDTIAPSVALSDMTLFLSSNFDLSGCDSLVVKIYANNTDIVDASFNTYYEGATYYSHLHTSFGVYTPQDILGLTNVWTANNTFSAGLISSAATHITGGLYDTSGSQGTSGQVLKSTGSVVQWTDAPIPTLTQVMDSGNKAGTSLDMSGNTITNALSVAATTFTGALSGNADTSSSCSGNALTSSSCSGNALTSSSCSGNAATATRSTNIAGGVASQIPYQTAVNTTAFIANGTSGQVLTSAGTSVPTWNSVVTPTLTQVMDSGNKAGTSLDMSGNTITNALSVAATTFTGALTGNASTSSSCSGNAATSSSCSGNAATATRSTNIAGGVASQIPYQTAVNTTAFIANGTSGQVLTSAGASAPTWATPSSTVANLTINATADQYQIAMGYNAGLPTQGAGAVAIGYEAGKTSQGIDSVAIGHGAGKTSQGIDSVAIGLSAGLTTQGKEAVSIGFWTSFNNQGNYAVAIGTAAAQTNQGVNAVAIGGYAALTNQGASAVAIGTNAGRGTTTGQGANSIAIGNNAASDSQTAGSICLNASGGALNPSTAGFYVNPVRSDASASNIPCLYNTTTKEMSYGAVAQANVTGLTTSLQYVDATSSIQTQLNAAAAGGVLGGVADGVLSNFSKFGSSLPNFGTTFTQLAGAPSATWAGLSISSTGQYQTAIGSNIFTSSNYGVTWEQNASTDISLNSSWYAVSVSSTGQYQTALSPNATNNGMFNSVNYGVTWHLNSSVPNTQNWNWQSVAVSATGKYQTAISNVNGYNIWLSSNYGVTWTLPTNTLNNSNYNAVTISASGQYQTSSGTSVTVISANYGATWSNATTAPTSSIVITGLSSSASGQYQTASARLGTGGVWTSSNYGVDWTKNTSSDVSNNIMYSITSVSASGQYQCVSSSADGGNGGIFVSSNYGNNWNKQTTGNFRQVALSANGQYLNAGPYSGPLLTSNISLTTLAAVQSNANTFTGDLVSMSTLNVLEKVNTVTVASNIATIDFALGGVFYVSPAAATNFDISLNNVNPGASLTTKCIVTLLINTATYNCYGSTCTINGTARTIIFAGGAAAISNTSATLVQQTLSIIYSGSATVPVAVMSSVVPFFA